MLRDVNLRISKGEFVSVIGRNGSGKSTLAKLLANQLMRYEGIISFSGTELTELSRKDFSKYVAYLPQSVSLVNEGVSVRELVLQEDILTRECLNLTTARMTWPRRPSRSAASGSLTLLKEIFGTLRRPETKGADRTCSDSA